METQTVESSQTIREYFDDLHERGMHMCWGCGKETENQPFLTGPCKGECWCDECQAAGLNL